jgi:hypothetical protein
MLSLEPTPSLFVLLANRTVKSTSPSSLSVLSVEHLGAFLILKGGWGGWGTKQEHKKRDLNSIVIFVSLPNSLKVYSILPPACLLDRLQCKPILSLLNFEKNTDYGDKTKAICDTVCFQVIMQIF